MDTQGAPPPPAYVRCRFHVPAGDGGARQIPVEGPDGSDCLLTAYPPAVGDVVRVHAKRDGGDYVVRRRFWEPVPYGSPQWPAGKAVPYCGPVLQLEVTPYHREGLR
jgi:hypothetical protein